MQKEHGAVVIGGKQIGSTLQCPHCGGHFISTPGSGAKRGWCHKCMAVVCGKTECLRVCIPFEKKLEQQEGKKHPNQIYIGK